MPVIGYKRSLMINRRQLQTSFCGLFILEMGNLDADVSKYNNIIRIYDIYNAQVVHTA